MHCSRPSLIVTLVLLTIALATLGGRSRLRADEPVDFATQVWPIIESHCLKCHGAGETFSNLRLDSPERIMKGGDLGLVVVAGKPDDSPLFTRTALPPDDLDFMPVEGDGLSEDELAIVRGWIEQGAQFGDWKAP